MAAVSAQGLRTVGPLFDRHLKPPAEVFDFQVGFPVSAPVAPAGRVRPGEIPAGRVVRTVYHGGYEGLAGAWEEFRTRLRKERLKPGKTFWQRYLLGPESNPDPSAWRTELNVPPVEDAP
jgi:effector-binding domain-containing protein